MTDFFKKLNVLVKASLHDLLGDEPRSTPLSADRLGKDVDREIASLRQRINEAVDYEETLRQRVQELQNDASNLDQQADDALSQGDDLTARRRVEELQRARQRLAMTEADLRDHQSVTQELILRVNQLEAAVADARRSQSDTAPVQPERSPVQAVSDVLRDMREKINTMSDLINAKDEVQPAPKPDDQTIDDDLATRRDRLSKK